MRWALVLIALVALAACTSPEATRQRAGGPGADVGNTRSSLDLHAGNDPYAGTPVLIPQHGSADVAASPGGR